MVEHLLIKQELKCGMCADKLSKRHEVDHIKPLGEGGSNDVSNLQLLCCACHASKTEHEERSSGTSAFHTLESQLSPHLQEVFHNAPKPREVSGSWTPLPEQAEKVRCLDAVGCRVNALVKYPRGLPIMSPLDHVELCTNDYADIVAFDYVYVDCPDVRLEDIKQARAAFPWTGSRWYCVGAVIYMLHVGAVTVDDCLYGIKAARHLEPKALEGAFDTIRAVMELALSNDPDYE